ncbi:hypothetical protein [Marinovum algicola]|mgnify:CR=1 FL=1|uniref:hypothetical protein n=1 Tax=Marinovum algicola TaxID=42444 RepID=UPI003B51B495
MPERTAIGAYASETPSGWTAYDKFGCTWPADQKEAEALEAARETRVKQEGPQT